jgi:hypothetical protein
MHAHDTIMSSSIGWPTSAAHAQSYLALTAMKSGVLHPAAARVLAALRLQVDNTYHKATLAVTGGGVFPTLEWADLLTVPQNQNRN